MIRFRALGTLDLRLDDGRLLKSVLSRPKRLAVLAYLVLARPYGLQRRDTLLGLFWPESSEKRARHSLNQTLYILRKALGPGALVTDSGEGVGVSPEHVSCDARELHRALEEGRRADALDLYAGELLEGFHLTGARRFEGWLEGERSTLRDRMVTAARELASEREAAGNPVGAIRALRKASAWSPFDPTLRTHLLRLLVAVGDRGGAVREYEAFAHRFREELGLAPPESLAALAASLRKEPPEGKTSEGMARGAEAPSVSPAGTRSAEAHPGTAAAVPEPPHAPTRRPAGRSDRSRSARGREWMLAAVAAAAVVVAVGLSTMLASGRGGERAVAGPSVSAVRIAVLPFEVRGNAERFGYLRHGAAELLVHKLDGVGAIRTVGVPADPGGSGGLATVGLAAPDAEAVRTVAEELSVEYVLAGSALGVGNRLQLQAVLYDRRGAPRSEAARGPAEESALFGMVDEMARLLVAGLHDEPPARLAGVAARTTSSLPALRSYLAGEAAFREARYGPAVDGFRQAVARDSTFALAWYRLAIAGGWAATPEERSRATQRAVRLAHRLPPRERRLLEAWQAYEAGSWKEAEHRYSGLVADYPDELEAWSNLGEVRYHGGWLRGRPLEDARDAFERALDLDPQNEGALLHLARIAAMQRRAGELERLSGILDELDRTSAPALEVRGLRAVLGGEPEALLRTAEELRALQVRHGERILAAMWVVFYADGPEPLRHLAPLLLEWRHPDVRAAGHVLLALEKGARGRWASAEESLRRAHPLNPVWATELRKLWSAAPFRPLPKDAPVDPAPTEVTSEGRATLPESPTTAFLVGHMRLDLDDGLRRHLDGLRGILSGDVERGLEIAAALDEAGDPLLPNLAIGLRAEALRRTAGSAAALEALDALPLSRPYEGAWISPFWALSRERWLRAEALHEAGRVAEALRTYDTFDEGPVWDLAYRAPAHLRRAWIHDRLGHPTAALDHYRRVLKLWEDPDPELEPLVELARARVRALHGMAE